jgi:hypothetical protein
MRARNVKPSFFQNEQLAELPFEARLLFVGLWCMADREGRLEDRPKRIKMHVFPADSIDVEPLLDGLEAQGLIERYEAHGVLCIQIPRFVEHQRPHPNEQPSKLPARTSNQGDKSFAPRLEADGLNPSSLNPLSSRELTHDSRGSAETPHAASRATRLPDDFVLTPERRLVAEAEKLPADRTFLKFRDYWLAASGAKARKHDWDATWRNWCRSESDRNGGSRGTSKPSSAPRPSAVERVRLAGEKWLRDSEDAGAGGVVIDG